MFPLSLHQKYPNIFGQTARPVTFPDVINADVILFMRTAVPAIPTNQLCCPFQPVPKAGAIGFAASRQRGHHC
jgi:hypothetical protein